MARKTVEEQFDDIGSDVADEASTRASQVECTPAEYRQGLKDIIITFTERLEMDIRASKETNPR